MDSGTENGRASPLRKALPREYISGGSGRLGDYQ